MQHVLQSSFQLKRATFRALRDGYFPIVLGGDHSQAMGSLGGFKKFSPDGRIIWIDAHIDANTPTSSPSGNAHGMPLSFLSGEVPEFNNMKCVNMNHDICYFGIRSFEDDEKKLIDDNECLVFESETCFPTSSRIDEIHSRIHQYFGSKPRFSEDDGETKYWISFDIDGIDNAEFKSTGTDEGAGLSFDFVYKLLNRFVPRAKGMDLTEINFLLTNGEQREQDQERIRDMFEFIVHQVNQPFESEMEMFDNSFVAAQKKKQVHKVQKDM